MASKRKASCSKISAMWSMPPWATANSDAEAMDAVRAEGRGRPCRGRPEFKAIKRDDPRRQGVVDTGKVEGGAARRQLRRRRASSAALVQHRDRLISTARSPSSAASPAPLSPQHSPRPTRPRPDRREGRSRHRHQRRPARSGWGCKPQRLRSGPANAQTKGAGVIKARPSTMLIPAKAAQSSVRLQVAARAFRLVGRDRFDLGHHVRRQLVLVLERLEVVLELAQLGRRRGSRSKRSGS